MIDRAFIAQAMSGGIYQRESLNIWDEQMRR